MLIRNELVRNILNAVLLVIRIQRVRKTKELGEMKHRIKLQPLIIGRGLECNVYAWVFECTTNGDVPVEA